MPLTAGDYNAILRSECFAEQFWKVPIGISRCKVNDNVNENDYYKDEIIFETLAGSQAVRNLPFLKVNKQSDEKKVNTLEDVADGSSPSVYQT